MLTPEERAELVSELATRPGHEKVRALLHRLLVDGLGADSRDIDFEKPVPEVHGRIDALLGRTVFELKSDLNRERRDAEEGLTRYLTEREGQTGERYVGIATDGADFIAFFLKNGYAIEADACRTDPSAPQKLLAWLQGAVAVGDSLLPDPNTITREFGRNSLAARRALDDLGRLWTTLGATPEARLKQELWENLLGLAYGAQVSDDALFLQHTYLAVVALLFDRILNNMIHFGERAEPPANFAAWMERESVASPADKLVLLETYGIMRRLQGEGRNHIWGYVAPNLARPVWLTSEAQKADVVIGNPPWVAYRYMSGKFKNRFRNECQAAGLWVGGKVATQQDLAGYFHLRAAALYLRQTGRMALVIPYAALSRQAWSLFRKGEVKRSGHVEFRLRSTVSSAGSMGSAAFRQIRVQPADSPVRLQQCASLWDCTGREDSRRDRQRRRGEGRRTLYEGTRAGPLRACRAWGRRTVGAAGWRGVQGRHSYCGPVIV